VPECIRCRSASGAGVHQVPECIEACRQIELGLFLASIENAAPPTS
jgi:hypothetical protein